LFAKAATRGGKDFILEKKGRIERGGKSSDTRQVKRKKKSKYISMKKALYQTLEKGPGKETWGEPVVWKTDIRHMDPHKKQGLAKTPEKRTGNAVRVGLGGGWGNRLNGRTTWRA